MNHRKVPTEATKDAPVELAEYDSTWPEKFELERQALAKVLGAWLAGPIEHVGSTAVHGLAAKPVIDIMFAVEGLEESRGAIAAAETLQYNYSPYKTESMHWFCKPTPEYRTHHLHLVPYGSWLWNARLCFRDELRDSDAFANDYLALKQQLAQQHRNDREAYTEGKSEFIRSVLSAQGMEPENIQSIGRVLKE
jgi:GrpB-like predicted nucleotidyltransferase (UPF0157 family)